MVTVRADIGKIDMLLNPYNLGEIFADMDSHEQMRFLNGFVSVANEFSWAMQCRMIAQEFDFNNFEAMKKQTIDCLKTLIEHLEDENDENT